MTLPLSSPDAVVLGTNTMDATAAFLQNLGFTETSKTVLSSDAAQALYGLTGEAEQRTYAVRDASGQSLPGRIRLVHTDEEPLEYNAYRTGGHAIDVYCLDQEKGSLLAREGGAEVGETAVFKTAFFTMSGTFCIIPGGGPVVLLSAERRLPSVLDDDPSRLHSQVHSLIWIVPELAPSLEFFAAAGLPETRRNVFGPDPDVAALMALPEPAPFSMALLADAAMTPSRLELLAFDTPDVPLVPDPGRPLRPGQMVLSFSVASLPAARTLLARHGASFGATAAAGDAQAVTGLAPGGIWLELRAR
ncbi:hypothetical protein [Actinocorallia populi]|uniref:hypothetical protein n=1 Tax=Actinocorallia populi TaxID=2079200 RepID=UPI000D08F4C7|nr:hypothetical protein [Actinocorallia populi]